VARNASFDDEMAVVKANSPLRITSVDAEAIDKIAPTDARRIMQQREFVQIVQSLYRPMRLQKPRTTDWEDLLGKQLSDFEAPPATFTIPDLEIGIPNREKIDLPVSRDEPQPYCWIGAGQILESAEEPFGDK
jgi:hypothetical protein